MYAIYSSSAITAAGTVNGSIFGPTFSIPPTMSLNGVVFKMQIGQNLDGSFNAAGITSGSAVITFYIQQSVKGDFTDAVAITPVSAPLTITAASGGGSSAIAAILSGTKKVLGTNINARYLRAVYTVTGTFTGSITALTGLTYEQII
jgi:hydrogenase maturation factor HypE